MRILVIIAAVLAVSPVLLAQTDSARFTGTITDPSGGVVPGARVVCVSETTGYRAETVSEPNGFFVFPSLPADVYSVTIEAKGFSQKILQHFQMTVAENINQTIKLEVGSVTTAVEVTAGSVNRVQTADAQISRVISHEEINTLPLGHEVLQIARYQPGVAENGGADKVNGNRDGSNNVRMDGVDSFNPTRLQFGQAIVPTNVDAVEEVRLVLSGAKAEYGRNAGGQVEIVTRSGSNVFHGNLLHYLRNDALNANTFVNNASGIKRPRLDQNYFGGSLGGPILKNKLFFFVNERNKIVVLGSTINRTVLTPEAKQGIFRWNAPASTAISSFNIPSNDPRSLGIDKDVSKLLALLPDPNNFDLGDRLNTGGFRFNNQENSHEYQSTSKVDYNATTKIRLFFRYSWLIADQVAADAIYPGLPNNLSTSASSGFAAGMDWIMSTRMVNELRVGKQHAESATTTPNRLPGIMILSSGLFTDPLNPAFASKATAPVTSVTDNISRIHGSHTFKAGFTWDRTLRSSSSDNGIYPNVTVSRNFGSAPPLTIGPSGALISAGARTNFESLFDVLLGRISNTDQTFYSNLAQYQGPGTPVLRNFRYQDLGFFIQDDWRVNRKLMLNVGIRYELFGPPTEDSKQMGILDQAGLVDGVHQLSNLTIKQANQWYPTDRNNFAPRFGFAYDPFGTGKTAIRGAFGIFFDRTIDNTAMAVDAATPGFVASTSVRPNQTGTTDVRLSDGVTLPAPPALANMPADTRSIASIQVINPNLRSAYVEEFNLSVQRQFAKIFVFEAAYVGSRGIKLFQVRDLNQPKIFGDFFQAFSELQAFQAKGTPVSPNNTLVRIFSTPAAAITSLGATNVQQGAIGTAATTLDNTFYTRYAAAGVSDFYIRNYPQFQSLRFGTNDGRSYYNSGQISLRVNSSKLKGAINYTHSKSIDTVSNDTNTNQIDSFNNRLNRGISDLSEPNVVTATAVYRLPLGKGEWLFHNVPRWANTIVGGWDLGTVFEGRSGYPMSITSGIRTTVTGSLINFNGDPYSTGGIDKRGDGVYFYTPGQIANFSLPGLGDYGNSGRNAFKGPPFTNQDASLAKQFKLTERIGLTLRAEFSNVWNHANFSALTGTSYQNLATFGRVGFSRNGRSTMLFARIDF